jgi:hypothetical protein
MAFKMQRVSHLSRTTIKDKLEEKIKSPVGK